MRILGIETSCDETAVAIVEGMSSPLQGRILSQAIASQISLHQPYGGVIPEIAARSHLEILSPLLAQCLTEASLSLDSIDAFAVTAGPGLIGGVLVGMMMTKALALGCDKPFLAINHLEGHILVPRLTYAIAFPYLVLLMSGGHTQFLLVQGVGRYTLLGTTLDDALGETFDKVARLLGFSYPGGPHIEQAARYGNPHAFVLPKPLYQKPGSDFSFSGLKTATAQLIASIDLNDESRANFSASFQETIVTILEDRLRHALKQAQQLEPELSTLVLAGGVAANQFIYTRLQNRFSKWNLIAPPPALCTDNGVMIAWAGLERFACGLTDSLDFKPRPRWPLEEVTSCLK